MDARSVGRHLLVCGIVEGETLIFNCYNNEYQSSKLKWCDNEDCNAKPNFDAVRRGATRCDAVRRRANSTAATCVVVAVTAVGVNTGHVGFTLLLCGK